LRRALLRIFHACRRGHVGSSLSVLEIVRVLYDDVLRYDSANPQWEDRDRFILSKGHGCYALYVLLAEKGFFPPEELDTVCRFGSRLAGHPEYGLPGVEAATGALGHGLSIGVGMALAARMDSRAYRTFVCVGDGECQEGTVWEAFLSASKHRLSNLTVIIDSNRAQCAGRTDDIQSLEPFAEKLAAFGLEVRECDGHNVGELGRLLKAVPFSCDKPSALVCHTRKGMGFPRLVDNPDWHHKSRLSDEEIRELFAELEAQR